MELIQEKGTDRLFLISCLEWRIRDHLVVYSCSIWPSGYLVIRVMFKVAAHVANACLCTSKTEMQLWKKNVCIVLKIFLTIVWLWVKVWVAIQKRLFKAFFKLYFHGLCYNKVTPQFGVKNDDHWENCTSITIKPAFDSFTAACLKIITVTIKLANFRISCLQLNWFVNVIFNYSAFCGCECSFLRVLIKI